MELSKEKLGLREAINQNCKECIGKEIGRWKREITLCQGYSCPLYSVRPIDNLYTFDEYFRPINDKGEVLTSKV